MVTTTEAAIENIEAVFRCRLPEDYREFLRSKHDFEVGDSFEFPLPPGCIHGVLGTVDHLHTAEEILENDSHGASWDPEAKMLIVGSDVCGGYIYLSLAKERVGIYFRAPYVSGEYFCVGKSFSEFMSALQAVVDE